VEGYKTSFFFQHSFGEKNAKEIELDPEIINDNRKRIAVLHWDPVECAFFASVKTQSWEHLRLKAKTICFKVLEKDAKDSFKDVQWVPTSLFDRLKRNLLMNQNYTCASDSDKIGSIYVY